MLPISKRACFDDPPSTPTKLGFFFPDCNLDRINWLPVQFRP